MNKCTHAMHAHHIPSLTLTGSTPAGRPNIAGSQFVASNVCCTSDDTSDGNENFAVIDTALLPFVSAIGSRYNMLYV